VVFVVQESPDKNLLPAAKYGELKILLSPGPVVLSPGPTVMKLRRELRGFCDEDYLLLIGDPAAIGIACMVAGDMNRGRVKVLKWDRQEQMYYPVAVDLYAGREKGESEDGN